MRASLFVHERTAGSVARVPLVVVLALVRRLVAAPAGLQALVEALPFPRSLQHPLRLAVLRLWTHLGHTGEIAMRRAADMRIATAAVRVGEAVFTLPRPARHCDVRRLIVVETERVPRECTEGFVTECGRFLNRRQAGTVARASGQTEKLKWPHIGLNSEDLW